MGWTNVYKRHFFHFMSIMTLNLSEKQCYYEQNCLYCYNIKSSVIHRQKPG